jgi:hypothetical protein
VDEVTVLRRRLARLTEARDQAEQIAEQRTRELYDLNQQLTTQMEARTAELALARDGALAASHAKTRFLATNVPSVRNHRHRLWS